MTAFKGDPFLNNCVVGLCITFGFHCSPTFVSRAIHFPILGFAFSGV